MACLPRKSPTAIFAAIFFVAAISLGIAAQAQGFSVIYQFTYGPVGSSPESGVTLDRAGNLEGTASEGGSAQLGAVYKLVHARSGWIASALHDFTGGDDGAIPTARVIIGPDGDLYGTTLAGGSTRNCGEFAGCGTVFQLRPPATICKATSCPWIETVLYRFPGGIRGALPGTGDLVFDSEGNIYGTTQLGGTLNSGTVYKLTRINGSWVYNVIYNFTGLQDGAYPVAGVILDAAGNLYGTTQLGGSLNGGTVYELSPAGQSWTEKTLHALNELTEGNFIQAGLIFDGAGNLFGAAAAGGPYGSGTVFEMTPSNGSWNLSVLYDNFGDGGGFEGPASAVALDSSGTLYGTSVGWVDGGNFGTVFSLTPSNGGWVYTLLHQFDGPDGILAFGGVTLDPAGDLYGTTFEGGSVSGTVWEIAR